MMVELGEEIKTYVGNKVLVQEQVPVLEDEGGDDRDDGDGDRDDGDHDHEGVDVVEDVVGDHVVGKKTHSS